MLKYSTLFLLIAEKQEQVAIFLQVETEYSNVGTRNKRKESTA
jgi:hypothetical protein